jgi:hypothetical protein
MKILGIELKFNSFDIWHKGNLTKVSDLTNDSGFITASGSTSGNAGTATKLNSIDVRNDNQSPSWYMAKDFGTVDEFKANTAIGLSTAFPEVPAYSQVSTHISWANSSGGKPVQIATNDVGIYYRCSANDSTWGTWNKVAKVSDIPTIPTSLPANGGNSDTVDGYHASDFYKSGSVIMNTNPFGGKQLFVNNINNAIFNANKRYSVTGNIYNGDDSLYSAISANSLACLFNGNYEDSLSVPMGKYAVINITFNGGNYPNYPYGYLYMSHYYNNFSQSAKLRVYCNYAPHGIGWHETTFGDYVNNGSTALIRCARQDYYAISQMEFVITASATADAWISQIDYQLDRPSSNEMPIMDKYKQNTMYYPIDMNNNTLLNVPNPSSALHVANKQYVDSASISGNAGTATKLATARTINGVSFDGSANITIADSTKEPTISAGTTAQYWRGDKSWQTLNSASVGLGSVNNTADSAKNVLSATKLTTARTINGVSFDGTGNITVADSTKVVANTAITGATKTKITYDAKGLVTGGADATTADIADSTDKRYCTDAQKTVIGNTSGTNSGNETTTTVGTLINGATAKATPIDADMVALMDSASSNVVRKLSWANIKATLKTYFDGLYALTGHTHTNDHVAVTILDSTSIDFTLTGQQITASAIFGTGAGTVCQGNDSRLSDSRTPLTHSHAESDITGLVTDLSAKAPLASPALTGVPTSPTATAGTNTTQIATTAFVATAVAGISVNGTAIVTSQTQPPSPNIGDVWIDLD